MKKKLIITAAIVLIVGTVIFIVKKKSRGSVDAKLKQTLVHPIQTTILRKVTTTGTIVPKKEVEIKSQVSGIVEAIFVAVGQQVKKGDPLLKIKLVPDLENLNSAESALRVAIINRDDASTELNRQQKLFDVGAIAETDLIKYKKDFKIKQEEVQSDQNRIQLIKDGVAKEFSQSSNTIVATCDGTVLEILTKEGRSIMGRSNFSEGTSLISLADMNQLIFQGKIAESDVDHLHKGMEIELTIGAIENEKFKATIDLIAPKGKDDQGSIKFDFTASVIPQKDKVIRAGYSANATIVLEKRENILAIYESDLSFSNDSAFVELKTAPDQFTKRHVVTGLSDGINIEIRSGLTLKDELKKISAIPTESVSINIQ